MASQDVVETMSDEEFRKLGPSGFARWLRTRTAGYGDYTRDRHLWLDGLTMDDIRQQLKELQTQDTLASK